MKDGRQSREGVCGRTHLLLALVIRPLTTHLFRDGAGGRREKSGEEEELEGGLREKRAGMGGREGKTQQPLAL